MYLMRPHRIVCAVLFFLGLLLVLGGIFLASGSERTQRTVFLVLGTLLAACGLPWVFHVASGHGRIDPVRDVLADDLGFQSVAEAKGVQWFAIPFPESISPPGNVLLAVFLQNAHHAPRDVTVFLSGDAIGAGAGQQRQKRATLREAEAGVLKLVVPVGGALGPGTHAIRCALAVRRPDGDGRRAIRREGGLAGLGSPYRLVYLEVLEAHEGERLNGALAGTDGYETLALAGRPVAPLDLRFTDGLKSQP